MGPHQPTTNANADKLTEIIKQARADLREMRVAAGLHAHPAGPHIDPSGHHANDTAEQQARERGEKAGHEDGGHEGHREGGEGHEARERGEHGGRENRREGRNREGKTQIRKHQKHDHRYRNGAHLRLQYNPATQAFVGHVKNTTTSVLSQVRVEIHLSNGRELGPTRRVDLAPGATTPIELSALDQEFTVWVTHPEAGTEEGHEHGGEGSQGHAEREKGEHGAGVGDGRRGEGRGEHGGHGEPEGRPDAPFRPVENQLLLLRGEMRAFKADLEAKKAGK